MKNYLFYFTAILLIISCSPCKKLTRNNPSQETAILKNLGGGTMMNTPILLKINNLYGTGCGYGFEPWIYNTKTNCGFNVEIPVGKTVLEVAYKFHPIVKIEFTAEKGKTYNIKADDENTNCLKVFTKDGNVKKEVSSCGEVIEYVEDTLTNKNKSENAILNYDNTIKDCIIVKLLKIDSLWFNRRFLKSLPVWEYFVYPEKTDLLLIPGKHTLELVAGNDTFQVSFEAQKGKTYKLDIINEIKTTKFSYTECRGDIVVLEKQ